MAKINPDTYIINYSDCFFFDTNIWILLFGTIADTQKREQKIYSSFFQKLIEKDKSIYITTLVLSEFSNVLLRKDYKEWIYKESLVNTDFKKDYVGSQRYKDAVASIKLLINKIISLPNIIKTSDSFNMLNIDSILINFESIDFNDSVILELCKNNKYKIVSNDKDLLIKSESLDIISVLN